MNSGLSVLPSFCPSVFHTKVFLILGHWFFLKGSMVIRAHVLLRVTARFLEKKSSCPKNWENGQKIGFLKYIRKFSHFFGIRFIMKVYTICCILAQIPYFGKSGFWDMGQNALGKPDYRIFKSTISLEQNDEKAWFFACWHRFM